MKYFTPELLAMGLTSDDQVLNEQERLWDEAGDRYVAYLDSVRPHFPPGLRHADEHYYLHDAVIQGMGRCDQSFIVMLQLDTPPYALVMFSYELVAEPVITTDVLPAELCAPSQRAEWQYDEIEQVPGDPVTWTQTILLSNGWEVKLHFRDMIVQEAQALLPMRGTGQPVSRSA